MVTVPLCRLLFVNYSSVLPATLVSPLLYLIPLLVNSFFFLFFCILFFNLNYIEILLYCLPIVSRNNRNDFPRENGNTEETA